MFLNVTSKTVLVNKVFLPSASKRTPATRYKFNFTVNQSLRLKLKKIMSSSWAACGTHFSVSPSRRINFAKYSTLFFKANALYCGNVNELQMPFISLLFTRNWGNLCDYLSINIIVHRCCFN